MSLAFTALCLLLPSVAGAEATPEGAGEELHEARWLVDLGLGIRAAGACFLSEPTNGREFRNGFVAGAEIDWGIFVMGSHRAGLDAGFLWLSPQRSDGNAAVSVTTRYFRLDLAAAYDFTWRLLVAGVHVGGALGVNRVVTTYGEPGWQIAGDRVEFFEAADARKEERVGVAPGFLAGLSVGVEIGELWGVPDLLEIRAKSDYVLRGARNEIAVYGLIVFWPTSLLKGHGPEKKSNDGGE